MNRFMPYFYQCPVIALPIATSMVSTYSPEFLLLSYKIKPNLWKSPKVLNSALN